MAAPAHAPQMEVPPPPPPAVDALGMAQRRRNRRRGARPDAPPGGTAAGLVCAPWPRPKGDGPGQVEWMLREFKTMPCGLEGNMSSHDHRCCPYFHNERDRRRPAVLEGGSDSLYVGEPCSSQFDDQRVCPHGDECTLCHSTAELLYHPDFFRKRLCHQAQKCPRGRFCAFAHNRQELLVPYFEELEESEPTEEFIIMRFKTQWCPVGGPHDWENCVYAHTYRDWRRMPELGYASHPCPRWSSSVSGGPAELSYKERCPNGFACPLAHGAKEQLYHPLFYKTGPCSDSNCRRGPLCAFTHGEYREPRDRREDSQRPARKPIPQAEELLRKTQPTFDAPPMYHALEDAPKMTSSTGSKSRNRRGRNGGGCDKGADGGNLAADAARRAAQQRVQSVPRPLQSAAFQAPAQQLPQYLCQMAQMMPAMETGMNPLGTLGAPPYGGHLLGTGSQQWNPYVGFHPPAPVVMGSRGAAPIHLPPHVPSYMVLPQPSNPPPPAPTYPIQEPIQAATGPAAESEFGPLPGNDLLIRHILEQERLDEQRSGKVDLAKWRKNYFRKDRGWRTPSSFGSPPMSALNTAEPTPQFVETSGGAFKHWGDAASSNTEDQSSEAPLTPRATVAAYTMAPPENLGSCK